MTNLDQILHQVADPAQREDVRRQLREATRQANGSAPLTGAYYWVPRPDRRDTIEWRVHEFYDTWGFSTGRVDIWKHIQDALHWYWGKSVRAVDYASLPRGRICLSRLRLVAGSRSVHAIYHGNDCPIDRRWLAAVRKAFNLSRDAPAIFDEHEQMIAGQPELLSRTLGFDLNLTGIEASWE